MRAPRAVILLTALALAGRQSESFITMSDGGADASGCADADGDGISDADEGAAQGTDTDGDGTPDYQDTDSDGDTIPDKVEAMTMGICGQPGDADADGTPNFRDTDSDGRPVADLPGDDVPLRHHQRQPAGPEALRQYPASLRQHGNPVELAGVS